MIAVAVVMVSLRFLGWLPLLPLLFHFLALFQPLPLLFHFLLGFIPVFILLWLSFFEYVPFSSSVESPVLDFSFWGV